jgi:putative ABC transport system permease protein
MRGMNDEITHHLEGEDLTVFVTYRPKAGSYPMDYIANTVLMLLTLLGGLILLIGGFLIVNTISALIAQQTRQIGVIKAIGGRTSQIAGIYLGMVLILSLLGALLAVPFSILGTRALVQFVGGLLNYDIDPGSFPPAVILLELAVGALVPVLAALAPVLGAAGRPPSEALNEYGRNRVWSGMHAVDKLLHRMPGLGSPDLLALRNPFRRRSRLIFTLIMLALAGGSFITVVNLRSAMLQTVDKMLSFWQYDFWVDLNRPYLTERLQKVAARVPGVSEVEGWGLEITRRIRPDGSESNPIYLFGVPPETRLASPTVLDGRWLTAQDTNALVVGSGLLDAEPGIRLGSKVVLKVNGKERAFSVVGVTEMLGNQTVGYLVYTPYATFSDLSKQENRADMAVVRTSAATPAENLAIGAAVERAYADAGIEVRSVLQTDSERLEISSAFNILVVLLMIMVVLLAFVGGLGLMGTMSLNVIERSREIGVIRAFGGSDRSVSRIVVLEGITIGVSSWLLGLLLALPLTWVFCELIGRSFLNMALAYRFSAAGAFLWLGIVVVLSVLSSLLPARSAIRATVREVLSYE